MLKVELSKKTTNPFYGLSNCLQLFQNGSKGIVNSHSLDNCWKEVQGDKEKREMFFSLLFSIGDITARQHNIFHNKKVDGGGSSQREAFHDIMLWLKTKNYPQFKKFLFANLFNEYTSFDTILRNRVKTKNRKKTVEKVFNNLVGTEEYVNDLADFVVRTIQGSNPANKYFLAKFLTRPRVSKRKGHKMMLNETRNIMRSREKFLKIVSDKANLPYVTKATHIEFTGYVNWRKEYIGSMESVLFSSGKIKEFDQVEFKNWLDKIPASARYRVRRRLFDGSDNSKPKWGEISKWFSEWEKFKEQKQKEVRVLEEKIRQGEGTSDDEAKLVKVKKEAKVTVGSVEFSSMYEQIVTGTIDKIKVQPFLDKINLPYNSLVFIDDSGSMSQYRVNGVTAFDFACFIATICLTKNPDDTGRSLLGFFSSSARLYSTMIARATSKNALTRAVVKNVNEPLIEPTAHFLDNLKRIREFATALRTSNGTNISAIPDYLNRQLQGDPTLIENLQSFPVWTIISDGNWNNLSSPEASINDFMRKCENYFGFKPFIVAIDVANNSSASIERFSGIDNFMFIPPNPAQVEQFLTNFKDIDIMDVYTPLLSIYRSNRYEEVRKHTV